MVSQNREQCNPAVKHIYDMAFSGTIDTVPEDIRCHISNCPNCSQKLDQMRRFISESAVFKKSRATSMAQIVDQAKRHFAFIGKIVDCRTVKGFLPLLADPKLNITIPTPITVHLDECRQCSEDYSTLRLLNLGSNQLARLAEVCSKDSFQNTADCRNFHDSIKSIAEIRFDQVAPDAFEHICSCRDCKELLFNTRRKMIEEASKWTGAIYPSCEGFDNNHFFYCCVPCADWPAKDWKEWEVIAAHLRRCPVCLEKIQRLHSTIYGIADRPQSGVVTCYELAPVFNQAGIPNMPVDCQMVKKYLPAFVEDQLELIMPSPLITHLETCPQCKRDFETLCSLGLDLRQLFRLRQIFAEEPIEDAGTCLQAQPYIQPFVAMDFDEIEGEVSRHLCTCTNCRELVYQHREEIIAELSSNENAELGEPLRTIGKSLCEAVTTSDLFEYCFPFEGGPIGEPFRQLHPTVILHIPICPACLARMQQLHRIISDIAERGNSGVLTGNECIVPAEKKGFSDCDYIYTRWPIKVRVRQEG